MIYYVSSEGDPRQGRSGRLRPTAAANQKLSTTPGSAPMIRKFAPLRARLSPRCRFRQSDPCRRTASVMARRMQGFSINRNRRMPVQLTRRAESLRIETAADGKTRLYADLLLPPGQTAVASVPLIVNPYGGPAAQTVVNAWGRYAKPALGRIAVAAVWICGAAR